MSVYVGMQVYIYIKRFFWITCQYIYIYVCIHIAYIYMYIHVNGMVFFFICFFLKNIFKLKCSLIKGRHQNKGSEPPIMGYMFGPPIGDTSLADSLTMWPGVSISRFAKRPNPPKSWRFSVRTLFSVLAADVGWGLDQNIWVMPFTSYKSVITPW